MKSDYEEIRTSQHRETFENFISEVSRSATFYVAVSEIPTEEAHRLHAILNLLGSAFKAGLVEGKLTAVKN